MPNLRETRISLLYAYYSSIINDEEFVLLYDINTAKSSDFPYWNYEAFELDSMSDDECQAEFRFYKNDVYDLMAVLGFPETFTCYNGLTHGRWYPGSLHLLKKICVPLPLSRYDSEQGG